MTKANNRFTHCTGTETWTRYMCGTLLTDGVVEMATETKSFWLLDIIASYQSKLKKHPYQYWLITKPTENAYTCSVICYNRPNTVSANHEILRQEIAFTTFEYDLAEIWVKDSVMLLPTED